MKTNITNAVVIITLHLAVVACSKMESNDMVFKSAVTSDKLASPVPGDQPDPVILENPEKVPTSTGSDSSTGSTTSTGSDSSTGSTTSTGSDSSTGSTTSTGSDSSTGSTTSTAVEYFYPVNEIPVCKINIVVGGMGSVENLSVVSASKDLLNSSIQKGFESLSTSELAAMRSAVDSLSSSSSVQVIKGDGAFDKSQFKNDAKILVVVDGSEAHEVKLNGLGKDSQIYIMAVAKDHNTVCVRNNGNSGIASFALTVQGDPKFVNRASADMNGTGSISSFIKVAGGNQTGSDVIFNSMKDLELTMITEGRHDTFSSISASSISGGKYNINVKGLDDTGFGVKTQSISDGVWNMQIEGEDKVSLLMSDVKLSNNEVSGSLKSKSGANLDQALAGAIELMTIP